jgi:hypothetical protein
MLQTISYLCLDCSFNVVVACCLQCGRHSRSFLPDRAHEVARSASNLPNSLNFTFSLPHQHHHNPSSSISKTCCIHQLPSERLLLELFTVKVALFEAIPRTHPSLFCPYVPESIVSSPHLSRLPWKSPPTSE